MAKKKTSGRRKIETKKIEDTNSRQVTFSKRRKGLFNKAGEICVLTGAEIAILCESIGGRVHAFAHPDIDSVIDTYLENNVPDASPRGENPACMYEEYMKKYSEIEEEIEVEVEKEKSKNLEESDEFWWENSFEDLKIDELEIFVDSLEQFKNNVTKKADDLRNNSDMSSSIDHIANANIVNGLLDDQVILSNLDQFIANNVGAANQDLMMPNVNYDPSGFINTSSFGNGGLVLDNLHDNDGGNNLHNDDGNDLQVQSNFGVPDDLYFGQGYF